MRISRLAWTICLSFIGSYPAVADCVLAGDARGSVGRRVVCDEYDYEPVPEPIGPSDSGRSYGYYEERGEGLLSPEEEYSIIRGLNRRNRGGSGEINQAININPRNGPVGRRPIISR